MTDLVPRLVSCRVCDLITSCTPVIEVILAVLTISIGSGLVVHPGLMAGSRALVELLDYMPQPAWALTFLAVGAFKLVAVGLRSPVARAASLMAGMLLWSHLVYVTGMEPNQPVLAPWLYGPLAMINAVVLVFLGWEMGRPRRVG